MAGLSSFGETTALNALLTGRFLSLHTGDPGNTGANEVAGGAYVRQSVAFTNSGNNPTVAANSAVVQYPAATATWGSVGFFGIWTAASGGSFIGGWPVSLVKTIEIDDIARWDVGKLKIGTDELVS